MNDKMPKTIMEYWNGERMVDPIADHMARQKADVERYRKAPRQIAEESAGADLDYREHTGEKQKWTHDEAWRDGHDIGRSEGYEAGNVDGYEDGQLEVLAILDDIAGKLDVPGVRALRLHMRDEIKENLKDIGRPVEAKS